MQPYLQKDASVSGGLGETSAFCGALYQRYAARLLAYLCRRLPELSDAEDALLDVFLAVLENEAALRARTEDQQCAWIWTVARNRAADHHRSQARKPQVPLQSLAEMADERRTPEQAFLRHEADEQLQRWIHKLPPLQQEVLWLRFSGGLRCVEIARILNKRDGTVRALLKRALGTLRGIYHE